MNCANHPQTAAVAYCRTCGKPLCESCKREVRGVIYCEDCLAARVAQQSVGSAEGQTVPLPAFAPPQRNDNPGGPNPAIAGILSGFLPFGTGVMYCGEYMRALVHAGILFGLIAIHNSIHGNQTPIHLAIVFWWIFMIFDSVRVAKAKQRGEPVPDLFGFGLAHPAEPVMVAAGPGAPVPVETLTRGPGFPTGAIILIGLGILFLAGNVWNFDWLERFWPLILIAFGLRLFFRRRGRGNRCQCVRCTASCSMGAAVLITLGVLFLLENVSYRFDFGHTWPLLLIVIGIVAFLRNSGPMEGHIEPPPPPQPTAPSEVHHG